MVLMGLVVLMIHLVLLVQVDLHLLVVQVALLVLVDQEVQVHLLLRFPQFRLEVQMVQGVQGSQQVLLLLWVLLVR